MGWIAACALPSSAAGGKRSKSKNRSQGPVFWCRQSFCQRGLEKKPGYAGTPVGWQKRPCRAC